MPAAASDLSAMAIIEVAQGLGLDVSADLSVAGFDDVPEASRLALPLTTVRQPMQSIGQTAARMLTTLMDGETLQSTHVLLPTKLVARATTAPPRTRHD